MKSADSPQECSSFPKSQSVSLGIKEALLAGGHTVGGWVRKDSVAGGLAQVSASVIYIWEGEREGREGINRNLSRPGNR